MDIKLHRKSKAPWQINARDRAPSNPTKNEAKKDGNLLEIPKTAASKSRRHNRRMSIHQTATNQFDISNLPPVPGQGMYRTTTNNSDMVLMRSQKEDDIVDIIKNELRDGDATAIDDFFKSLLSQKAKVEADMKNRINQNQQNILHLTDDLRATQEELVQLRGQTKELYAILGEFSDTAERRLELEHPNQPKTVEKKKKDRLSVLVLQQMWATELQLLYKHVDGAQKHITAIPGRHVLAESGRWHEINVGTWKAGRPIHLFFLNDMVLVATRKLPQEGNSKRLQAVHCWPLHAVKLSEITAPDLATKVYVVNLRAALLSYVYQTDRYDHFTRVMQAYNKGKAELMQKDRMFESSEFPEEVEAAEKKQLRDSLRGSFTALPRASMEDVSYQRRTSQRHSAEVLQDLSARVHSRNRSHDFAATADKLRLDPSRLFGELKTTEDKLDEVDVQLAHNEYMAAVGLLKHIEGKVAGIVARVSGDDSELRLLVDVVRLKINARKLKVQQGLLFDLNHNIATLTTDAVGDILEFYASFDKLAEGIDAYLEAMLAHLARTVGKLISNAHGSTRVDIVNYLANMTIVHVLVVRRTVVVHRHCVEPMLKRGDNGVDSSGFVTWCVLEVTLLVEAIKRHAAGTLLAHEGKNWVVKDEKYYAELIHIVKSQLALLKREGLNVDYLFDDILRPGN